MGTGVRGARSAPASGLALATLCLLGALPLPAQTLRGTLLDLESGEPIPEALVVLITEAGDTVAHAITDGGGLFSLTAPAPGDFYVGASTLGYRIALEGIFELGIGGEISVELRLTPEPLTIAGLTVTRNWAVAEPPLVKNGFFERLAQGAGHFITPVDLANSSATRLTDVLATIPFLAVVNAYPTDRVLVKDRGAFCTPSIFVDGLLASEIPGRRGPLNQISGSEGDIEALVALKDVEAVEAYRGGQQLPSQLGGMSRTECGAIVIWTKRR